MWLYLYISYACLVLATKWTNINNPTCLTARNSGGSIVVAIRWAFLWATKMSSISSFTSSNGGIRNFSIPELGTQIMDTSNTISQMKSSIKTAQKDIKSAKDNAGTVQVLQRDVADMKARLDTIHSNIDGVASSSNATSDLIKESIHALDTKVVDNVNTLNQTIADSVHNIDISDKSLSISTNGTAIGKFTPEYSVINNLSISKDITNVIINKSNFYLPSVSTAYIARISFLGNADSVRRPYTHTNIVGITNMINNCYNDYSYLYEFDKALKATVPDAAITYYNRIQEIFISNLRSQTTVVAINAYKTGMTSFFEAYVYPNLYGDELNDTVDMVTEYISYLDPTTFFTLEAFVTEIEHMMEKPSLPDDFSRIQRYGQYYVNRQIPYTVYDDYILGMVADYTESTFVLRNILRGTPPSNRTLPYNEFSMPMNNCTIYIQNTGGLPITFKFIDNHDPEVLTQFQFINSDIKGVESYKLYGGDVLIMNIVVSEYIIRVNNIYVNWSNFKKVAAILANRKRETEITQA